LKLNPAKCSFRVKYGKLLGFVVSSQGIEIDFDKIKAIQTKVVKNAFWTWHGKYKINSDRKNGS
jgi:hypothetical protein